MEERKDGEKVTVEPEYEGSLLSSLGVQGEDDLGDLTKTSI